MARLLIAFDGSPSARAAIRRSAALLPGAEAVVATVAFGLDELESAASAARARLPEDVVVRASEHLRESALTETREVADEGARLAGEAGLRVLRAEARVAGGGPLWAAVMAAARDAQADAVVCGTHGHGAVSRAILGSVASGLVHHAELPVLVVPADARPGDGPIVVGYDGSAPSMQAIEACARLLPGREAIIVHVWRSRIRHTIAGAAFRHAPIEDVRGAVTELDGLFEQWAGEDAEEGARLARERGLDARALAIESAAPPSRPILDVAEREHASAIAVGRRGRGAVAAAVLGSVSSSLLHAAGVPVLVV